MSKNCQRCGATLNEDASFCTNCGLKLELEPENKSKVCASCGATMGPEAKFCASCGKSCNPQNEWTQGEVGAADFVKNSMNRVANSLNQKMGESGPVEVKLSDLFSEVPVKHTQEELEELFIAGTKKTTPKESEIIAQWPKPWVYSRVFAFLFAVCLILYFGISQFDNWNCVPGFIFMAAMSVPFSLVIFFWEMNAPRNISAINIFTMFFVGGVLSMVFTLFLFTVTQPGELTYVGAMLVGLTEEVGKIAIAALYIKKTNAKYILNGLLIGACIGAGFAAFETAGYGFRTFLGGGMNGMLHILLLRGATGVGTHIIWTAIAGAALVAAKGEKPFDFSMLLHGRFLFFLCISIVFHGLWDSPLEFPSLYGKYTISVLLAWGITLVMISSGLKQITRLTNRGGELQRQNS